MQKVLLANNQFYYTTGQGPIRLMLVHGYAETPEIFQWIVPQLAEHCTIVLPNIPGSNHTDVLPNCSIDAMADYCFQIMQNVKWSNCHVMGHSMGGYIALNIAERYPNTLLSLGLLNSHCYADDTAKVEKRMQAVKLAAEGEAKQILSTLVNSIYSEQFKNRSAEIITQHVAMAHTINAQGVAYYNNAMASRKDHSQTLSSIRVPALICIADKDTTCDYKLLQQQLTFAPITQSLILRNCGHQGMVEQPKLVASTMINFLQETCI
ncbi:MAG: hypothetical protein RL660_521 [Bacteroidota bacterium]|jgi:pimeloyl-ACP methyl ester carboxylesterase